MKSGRTILSRAQDHFPCQTLVGHMQGSGIGSGGSIRSGSSRLLENCNDFEANIFTIKTFKLTTTFKHKSPHHTKPTQITNNTTMDFGAGTGAPAPGGRACYNCRYSTRIPAISLAAHHSASGPARRCTWLCYFEICEMVFLICSDLTSDDGPS